MPRQHWDIFCQVIDNYGDVGVAWRLARQMAAEHAIPVRLWVNDLTVFNRLWPDSSIEASSQYCQGVEVCAWGDVFPPVTPASIVIEAFGCRPPQDYLAVMGSMIPKPVWINLEYLSAEAWVSTHHGLASPHPTLPLNKYFFFPGYQIGTGGVLRERDLMQSREDFLRMDIAAFWQCLGLEIAQPQVLRVSLFAYENAALAELLDTWVQSSQPIVCLVPEGKIVPQISAWLGLPSLQTGSVHRRGQLEIHVLRFMDQDNYDRLLWACDLNFVRGEDSCVRAQWAQKPFVWQAYPQDDHAHWNKLDAFNQLYTEDLPEAEAQAITGLCRAWNGRGDVNAAWANFICHRPAIETHAKRWTERLAAPGDLVTNLLAFVEHHQAG